MDRYDDELQSVEAWAAILDAWEAFTQTTGIPISYAKLNASYFADMSELAPGKSLHNIAFLSGCIIMYITQWKITVCYVDHLVFIGK